MLFRLRLDSYCFLCHDHNYDDGGDNDRPRDDDNDVFVMTTGMQNAERNKSLEGDGSAMRLLVVGSNTRFLVEQYFHHQTQALPSMIISIRFSSSAAVT